jgi:hypothetical protein
MDLGANGRRYAKYLLYICYTCTDVVETLELGGAVAPLKYVLSVEVIKIVQPDVQGGGEGAKTLPCYLEASGGVAEQVIL